MNNILIQYDWNNHKAMDKRKLTNEFAKLTLSDKLKVYRILTDRRRLLLNKGYSEIRLEKNKVRLENNKKYVTLPLADLIDINDIKTDDEIFLTLGILLHDSHVSNYVDDESSNYHKEQESFEKAKKKFIGFFEKMYFRRYNSFPHEEDGFYSKLKTLEYVPPTTLTDILKWKKEKWLNCYIHIGVGRERAERITNALIKRLKITYEYDAETLLETNRIYMEWWGKIRDSTRTYAMRKYSIISYELGY